MSETVDHRVHGENHDDLSVPSVRCLCALCVKRF